MQSAIEANIEKRNATAANHVGGTVSEPRPGEAVATPTSGGRGATPGTLEEAGGGVRNGAPGSEQTTTAPPTEPRKQKKKTSSMADAALNLKLENGDVVIKTDKKCIIS